MRYAIRYHEISNDWMVFNVGDGFELVGVHTSEEDAATQVKDLENVSPSLRVIVIPHLNMQHSYICNQ